MRRPLYDLDAAPTTIGIALNSDLAAKSLAVGLDLSRLAEEAIAKRFIEVETDNIRRELVEAGRITGEVVAKYGYPFDNWLTDSAVGDDEDDAA